ncbi:fibro-slime domain-containing protein [Pseudoflavonifractor phocaeensis]|uniref:DUF7601 domain-containing protein n=1 Tax=Pseudoflavonifractor phocaeensis TaxID=1870988 RepID=UPI001F25B555|nr:fibro-slime domain-containing protein [Pseudoflavonifractor phocaeensis]MCF2662041.1 fibro-slime domain-containing protein [Pseudoflavonifractor phocaeensis]
MQSVKQMIRSFTKQRKQRRRAYAAFTTLAILVSITTMYTLSQPAATLAAEPVCGLEEHVHTADCYARQLICGIEEQSAEEAEAHVHDASCYEQVEKLVCGQEETPSHTHDDSCWGLICGQDEYEAHTHDGSCYITVEEYGCGQEECEGHEHSDACYTTYRELACGQDECEGHWHDDSCYDENGELICDQDEYEGHQHDDSCYEETAELTCGLEEGPGHTHDESCLVSRTELTCGAQEGPGHVHDDSCYGYICGQEETEGHQHTEDCYELEDVLVCTVGHVHTDACYAEVLTCGKTEHTHSSNCYAETGSSGSSGSIRTEDEVLEEQFPEELPEGYRAYEFENEDGLSILAYAPEDAFKTEVVLFAQQLAEGSDGYAEAEEGLEQEEDLEYDGFVALDIRFVDPSAADPTAEVEPDPNAGRVYVKIEAKALLPDTADESSLAVQHHKEEERTILGFIPVGKEMVMETVADQNKETGKIAVTPIKPEKPPKEEIKEKPIKEEPVKEPPVKEEPIIKEEPVKEEPIKEPVEEPKEPAPEVPVVEEPKEPAPEVPVVEEPKEPAAEEPVVEEPEEPATEEPVVEEPNEEPNAGEPADEEPDDQSDGMVDVTAEFTVDSFSTFTVTWVDSNGKKAIIHYVYEDGTEIENITQTDVPVSGNGSVALKDYAKPISGYYYSAAHLDTYDGIIATDVSFNSNQPSDDYDYGKQRIGDWYYYANEWLNWPDKSNQDGTVHVYMVYESNNPSLIQTADTSKFATINLFDYDARDDDPTKNINYGHTLSFTASKYTIYYRDTSQSYNVYYSGTTGLQQKLVSSTLVDGYPQLKVGNQESLSYLFSPDTTDGGVVNKYLGLNHLFIQDGSYYRYDSAENFATLIPDGEDVIGTNQNFNVYNKANPGEAASDPNFLPLDQYGAQNASTTNFHFGMTVSTEFMMPKNCQVDGEDMVFNFAGDDDVWVYIDDVLVLDMGGIHDNLNGSINFTTGTVQVDGKDDTTLAQLFADAEKTWDGTEFSKHTFNMFYLERGGSGSNCRIEFNMYNLQKNALYVGKNLESYDVGGEVPEPVQAYLNNIEFNFRVLKKDAPTDTTAASDLFIKPGTSYDIYANGVDTGRDGVVAADGTFKVKAGENAVFSDISENSGEYYVQEVIEKDYSTQYGDVIYTVSGNGGTQAVKTGDILLDGVSFEGHESETINARDGTAYVDFTNKIDWSKISLLSLTKTVRGTPAEGSSDTYYFKVLLGDETGAEGSALPTGTTYQLYESSAAGSAETKTVGADGLIALQEGQVAKLNILAGTEFYVIETDADGNAIPGSGAKGFVPTYEVDGAGANSDAAAGVISQVASEVTVEVTNTFWSSTGSVTITKKFKDADGNVLVDLPVNPDHICLTLQEYYIPYGSTEKTLVGSPRTVRLDWDEDSSAFTGTLSGVKYFTQFEILAEKLCSADCKTVSPGGICTAECKPILTSGTGFTWNAGGDLTIDRNYGEAVATVIKYPKKSNAVFTLSGTGYVVVSSTGGSSGDGNAYLWMPYENEMTAEEKQEVKARIFKIGEAASGGNRFNFKESDFYWLSDSAIGGFSNDVTITPLEDGGVTIDFRAQSTWTMFWYGEFNFTDVNIDAGLSNTIHTGDLALTKTVKLNGGGSGTGTFTFDLSAKGLKGTYELAYQNADGTAMANPPMETITFRNGVATDLQLPAGATVTIQGLPVGVTVNVTETHYDGYAPSWSLTDPETDQNATVHHGATAQATVNAETEAEKIAHIYFTNTTGAALPSTGGAGTHIFTLLGMTMMLGAGVLLMLQRRRREGPDAG